MTLSELHTPCGILRCCDQENNSIPFSSSPPEREYDTAVYDEIKSDWVKVIPEYQATISVATEGLEVGKTYTLRLYGEYEYHFGASDENAVANIITCNGYSLSLGAYDPNDEAKDRQWVPVYKDGVRVGARPPEEYDTSEFRGYVLSILPDWSGYSFRLSDYSLQEVIFRIAWIKHDDELVAEISDYENAVTLITTF